LVEGQKAFQQLTRDVRESCKDASLSRTDELVYLSLMPLHPQYAAIFGDCPPSCLRLTAAPSLRFGSSICLVVFDPVDPRRRLDVGTEDTFGSNIRNPDAPQPKVVRRKLMGAIRGLDVHQRRLFMDSCAHAMFCSSCAVALVTNADGSITDTSPEAHHNEPVARLTTRMFGLHPDPKVMGEGNQSNEIVPGRLRQYLEQELAAPGRFTLLCHLCHLREHQDEEVDEGLLELEDAPKSTVVPHGGGER